MLTINTTEKDTTYFDTYNFNTIFIDFVELNYTSNVNKICPTCKSMLWLRFFKVISPL